MTLRHCDSISRPARPALPAPSHFAAICLAVSLSVVLVERLSRLPRASVYAAYQYGLRPRESFKIVLTISQNNVRTSTVVKDVHDCAIHEGKSYLRRGGGTKCGFDSRCPLISSRSALFVCSGFLMFTEPRYVFAYYTASFYECAWFSKFWIEHTNIGRKCRQKSTEIRHSVVFERCLAHGFRRKRLVGICCS